jgi:RimJ/RimL family protein N-acetyltransferase
MELYTKRLYLRDFRLSDIDAVHEYSSDPENVYYMVWGPNSRKDTICFIDECIRNAGEVPRTAFDFAVIERAAGRLIGGGGLYLDRDRRQAMMGYILHKNFWYMGYGTEFAGEMLRFGFLELNLHRIYASCNSDNYGSYRVMEKNYMRREAYFKQSRYERVGSGTFWADELIYAILREEWENKAGLSAGQRCRP